MKIVQVISYFYPAWSYGGPGKLVYDITRELVRQNNQVTILSTDALSGHNRRSQSDNEIFKNRKSVNAYFFHNISNDLAFKSKVFIPLINIKEVVNEIKQSNIIHIHEFFTPLAIISSLIAKIFKKPCLISSHGTLDSFHLAHRHGIKQIFMYLFGKSMIKNASYFIAATEEEIKEYQQLGIQKDNIRLVRNGLDLNQYKKMPTRGRFRNKYKIGKDQRLIVYLGRINKLKGLDILLESFAKLNKTKSVCLVIAGSDDGYLLHLQNKANELGIKDHVIFTGIMHGEEKLEMYGDADIFAYPSPAEGFSIAILEAGASGLPLLVTYGCKFPTIEKTQAGIIVDSKTDLFYNAMNKMLTDDKKLFQMGVNARNLVNMNYSIETMVKNLLKIYQKANENYG